MWEPSQAYIGVEPNYDAPVQAGADSMTNFAQDKILRIEHAEDFKKSSTYNLQFNIEFLD
jgi:hypothetical protein